MGQLLPGVSATINDQGVLVIASDAVGLGYDQTLPGEVFGAGRFQTCDRVLLAGQELHFEGCVGRGINVAGRKLSPEEIATKLRAATGMPGIQIHGGPSRDPERCQEVVAEVALPAE